MTKNNVLYTNNAKTLLTSSITTSSTTIPVTSTTGFPTISVSGDYFYITIDNGTNIEVIKVGGKTSNTFTSCVRGQEGTTPFAFATSTAVSHRLTAGNISNLVRKSERLADYVSVDNLPAAGSSDGNSALCSVGDLNGAAIVAVNNGTTWRFPSQYPGWATPTQVNTVGSGATTTSINMATASTVLPVSTAKFYIVQMLTGANAGLCRFITSRSSSSFSWATALPSTPGSSDTYEIFYFSLPMQQSGGTFTGSVAFSPTGASIPQLYMTHGASDTNFILVARNGAGTAINSEQARLSMEYSGTTASGISFIRGAASTDGSLGLLTNNATRVVIASSGNVTFNQDIAVVGYSALQGNVGVSGTLGVASTASITGSLTVGSGLAVTGDISLTGNMNLSGNATSALRAVPKQQLDAAIAGITSSSLPGSSFGSGYIVLPGGLILQWGTITLTFTSSGTFTYPYTLTTALYHINATIVPGGYTGAVTETYPMITSAGLGSCVIANQYIGDTTGSPATITAQIFIVGK